VYRTAHIKIKWSDMINEEEFSQPISGERGDDDVGNEPPLSRGGPPSVSVPKRPAYEEDLMRLTTSGMDASSGILELEVRACVGGGAEVMFWWRMSANVWWRLSSPTSQTVDRHCNVEHSSASMYGRGARPAGCVLCGNLI